MGAWCLLGLSRQELTACVGLTGERLDLSGRVGAWHCRIGRVEREQLQLVRQRA